MRIARLALIILWLGAVVIGCSEVGFESIPKISCSNISKDQNTTCDSTANSVTITFSFRAGDLDILFVDDNSGSMSTEQAKMANAFQNFISNISNLFYQIAIITTDVSTTNGNSVPRAANGFGAFQDGKFLEFIDEAGNRSGKQVISHDTTNADSLFKGTIKRAETLYCDGSGYNPNYCPSTDERGIYALNMAINRGDKSFFRPGAHLAIVILSDEDERSEGGAPGKLALETSDLPESLVMNMKRNFPTKSFSVHSLVTNNETCRKSQTQTSITSAWPTLGFIGTQYMNLSNPSQALRDYGNIMTGTIGSICDSSYSNQLTNISANISTNTLDAPKQLSCTPDPATIRIITSPSGYENQISSYIDNQNKVYFYNLPIGVKVSYSYECPRY